MHQVGLKDEAIKLRLRGKTYSDINFILKTNISKSTFSGWFKKVELTNFYKNKLKININTKLEKARIKALQTNQLKRSGFINEIKIRNKNYLKNINLPTRKLLLSILYRAEGAKYKSTSCMNLANSDPEIIKFYLYLLRSSYKIDKSKFRIRIQCRADQNSSSLEKFWQKVTKIGANKTYPTYVDKRTTGKQTLKKEYKGVCTVHYLDALLHQEIELLADSMIKYLINSGL